MRRRKTKWPCSTHGTHFKKERKVFAQTQQRDGGEHRQVCVGAFVCERVGVSVKTSTDDNVLSASDTQAKKGSHSFYYDEEADREGKVKQTA